MSPKTAGAHIYAFLRAYRSAHGDGTIYVATVADQEWRLTTDALQGVLDEVVGLRAARDNLAVTVDEDKLAMDRMAEGVQAALSLLENYGRHFGWCHKTRQAVKCDCGFDDALENLRVSVWADEKVAGLTGTAESEWGRDV
jgi:hypothetical protein